MLMSFYYPVMRVPCVEGFKVSVLVLYRSLCRIRLFPYSFCASVTLYINQLSFSRLLSHWKRRFATILQKENALFILNSSSHVLFATNRFEPNCEPNLGEVLNLESIHCS